MQSVVSQTRYPGEIIIVDGSPDEFTRDMLSQNSFENLKYYLVPAEHRGLTKQRNYGIKKVDSLSEIVCFLDDDTILEPNYFEEIAKTYVSNPLALGVGGYITNEVSWTKIESNHVPCIKEFYYDGWKRKEGSRFVWRKKLGLDSNRPPGYLPEFSHGRSIGFLPPSGKVYEVEQLMGGVSSFRKGVFDHFQFSTYFEGYGLYEDAEFTLRLSKTGKLFVNTLARLGHYHDSAGRPNKFSYGKMVVRNGWFVWRAKHSAPSLKSILKWHLITLLLTAIRMGNVLTTTKRKEAFTESAGRLLGWISLFFSKPKHR
ncbi:glycosyl transferase [Flavobacterium enshiense DK69]|nr:glycosyl transferase [Flavobacterium enshiense DK69]